MTSQEQSLIIRVEEGSLEGKKTKTKTGGQLIVFHGIPYAKPPLGELRFKPPQPHPPWEGVYKALKEPPICCQYDNRTFLGQEDCLYLNVYTKEVVVQRCKPVMVWIHGGGFVNGSGNTDLYGPDYLVDEDVVLVTFNYRLAALGFLSLDNEEVMGNMGLKDQVLVLRWVQRNISAFGGDPGNITIFGESAGAVSVNYHMLSSMTKGLFHKAIAQSGSALNPWGFTRECRARAFRLGKLLGCETTDATELLNFLQNVEVKNLLKASEDVLPKIENTTGLKIVFVPTVEPVVPHQESYLTEEPIHLLKKGNFHKLPYITGTVTHEGMINLRDILKNPSLLHMLNNNFELAIPRSIKVGLSKEQVANLAKKVRQFYLENQPLSTENMALFLNYHTDVQMAAGIHLTAKLMALYNDVPVYFYNFAYDGELNCVKKAMGRRASIVSGPYHGDDLGYLFRLRMFDPDIEPSSVDTKVRNWMVKLWTNFAKRGRPTPLECNGPPIDWIPFTVEEAIYLEIDQELTIKTQLRHDRMQFWENLSQCKL